MNEPTLRIVTGSVYHPPEDAYPRLLVMRRWPRGVKKDSVDQWERDLGPSDELLDAYNAGSVEWEEFARRYRAEMEQREGLLEWVTRMAAGTGVVLLCGSHPEERCHRGLLAAMVRERAARRAQPDA